MAQTLASGAAARARRQVVREGVGVDQGFDGARHRSILPAGLGPDRSRRASRGATAWRTPRLRGNPACGQCPNVTQVRRQCRHARPTPSLKRSRCTHEKGLLHDHVGAVLQLARRQRAAGGGDRDAEVDELAVLADPGARPDVRVVLRDPRAVPRRLRRRGAQGQGDVLLERHQGRRLPADAVRRPPAARVRDRRPGRGGLLAGQVRHPDRAAAELAARQGQRLDRGADDHVDHPRHRARRAADRRGGLAPPARRSTCR